MIPFASQRGLGQDLATHLMNKHDNEYMELAQVRGAVARDLHGAFAEWEAQAAALTRCRNYLYSLSVNPDPAQGPLTRAQYLDYIERVEDRLGLAGQPRAIVFHIKEDGQGRPREHCHVVWSRIDAGKGKAVPLAFDHDKLMMVTREFARGYGLTLPEGYENGRDGKNRQLSLYEKVQQDRCGISKEARMALITALWQQCDSAKAFVQALEQNGYILATGKRPFVLVDIYGHTNALPKLIDDRQVRTNDVRAFLGTDYAPENLPRIEQAQALAARHRKAIDEFEMARIASNKQAALEKKQAARRQKLEAALAALRRKQHEQRAQLAAEQKSARHALKAAYLAAARRVRIERARHRPTGLAAFLGRITGAALIAKKLQAYRDRKRYGAYLAQRDALKWRQQADRDALVRRQELQAADLIRQLRGLAQVERRERKSLETAGRKEARQRLNARHGHMPAITPAPMTQAAKAAPDEPDHRKLPPLAEELARAANGRQAIDLAEAFGLASGGEGEGDTGRGESGGPGPAAEAGTEPRKKRASRRLRHFNEAAQGSDDGGSGGEGDTEAPAPDAEAKIRRRKRRKLDLDRDFNAASGASDDTGGDDSGGGPRRRRPRQQERRPPRDHDPPPPRRTRKRDFGRGM